MSSFLNVAFFFALSFWMGTVHAQNIVSDDLERDALMALYDNTSGGNWISSKRWRLTQVQSYPDSIPAGVEVENGDIVGIQLDNARLSGILPAELNSLTELLFLQCRDNPLLGGRLPNLAGLKKLKTFDFHGCNFNDDFPSWITDLVSLEVLNLNGLANTSDQLHGPIPPTISGLVNLKQFYFSDNDLSAIEAIPDSFSELDNLEILNLIGCKLTLNSVEDGLSDLGKLRMLFLSKNPALVTSDNVFPDILRNLPSLQHLQLRDIDFHRLPQSFDQLSSLTFLDLNENDYANPQILSSIIDTLQNCPTLKTLSLAYCKIIGLPDNIWRLSSVDFLYLNNNINLDPVQCEILGQMPKLRTLYIYSCNLSTLPSTLPNLSTLEVLYANWNNLYPIPELIKDIPNLEELYLSYNNIGSLPEWFGEGSMNGVRNLTLDNNQITLPLPDNFRNLTDLAYLSLARNNLNGPLPDYIKEFTEIYFFDISYNQIESPIPDLSAWNRLSYIYFQHNNFTGDFPSYLSNTAIPKNVVDISYNHFKYFPAFKSSQSSPPSVLVNNNEMEFEDVLKQTEPIRNFVYAPQDSVDQTKIIWSYVSGDLMLIAEVDTATLPPSYFQWFKILNGVTQSISQPSIDGRKFLLQGITEGDQGAKFFYKITNPAAPQLTLTSRLQTLQLSACNMSTISARFSNRKYLCAIKFTPLSPVPSGCRVQSYDWDFGDGTGSLSKSPIHSYANPGNYNVSLRMRYSCGSCEADTVFTRMVAFEEESDVLVDTLIFISSELKKEVINGSVATFSDSWPLQHEAEAASKNSFMNASQGVWRNNAAFVYMAPRDRSPFTNISKDGTYTLEQFDWEHAEVNAIPNWIKTNSMTDYSPFGYELENRDALGVYSAALYDYGGHLPSATGVNMRNKEMAFTSFESLNNNVTGNWIFGDESLPRQTKYRIRSARENIALVEASIVQLQNINQADVAARFLLGRSRMNYLEQNRIVCSQPYEYNSEWTYVVFEQAPFTNFWLGDLIINNEVKPLADPIIDNTFSHSGRSSLKITSPTTFKQELLKLDSGQTYWVSAWVSIHNGNLLLPKLADNLGINVIIRDQHDQGVSTVSFTPVGNIIEGWQQVKGSFVCSARDAVLEMEFNPGTLGVAWYDDLRLHPEKGNMKCYVYDLNDYRLRAILDEENFASFFYYDVEGNLYLTKKETEKGIKTLTENVGYQVESLSQQ